jgi:potassium-transporting ATPase KdpC subunit
MIHNVYRPLLISIRALVVYTILCGILYPLSIFLVGQTLWKETSNGQIIKSNEIPVASAIIGQSFTKPEYFWSRPSASQYEAIPSGASQLSPYDQKLKTQMENREKTGIPREFGDLLTASGSGLDPAISVKSAQGQLPRIVQARHWDPQREKQLQSLIEKHTMPKFWGLLGEDVVNVVTLNLELKNMEPSLP